MWMKILTCDTPTSRTGRTYPKEIMEAAVEEYRDKIDNNIAFGQVGDTATPEINIAEVSHRVTDMRFDGDDLYADIEILDTPAGEMLKDMISVMRLSPVGTGLVDDDLVIEGYEFHKTQFLPNDREE